MRAVLLPLLLVRLILVRQVVGSTIKVDAGTNPSTYTVAGNPLKDIGASIRLTQYNLPASTVYYLPAGSPHRKKTVNQTRPLANGYPPGWKLLFYPAALSQSNKRWLVYDARGHFKSYDTVDTEENDLDFYDYDDTEPAGCQRGLEAQFLLGAISHSTPWSDIPVNKAAFWVEPAAAAAWNSPGEGLPAETAISMQPILCRAVPVRVVTSDGSIYNLFPIASIALAAVIVFMTLLTVSLVCCSACARTRSRRQPRKRGPSAIPLTSQ